MRIFAEDWRHLSNSNKFDCIRFAQSLQKIGGLGIKLLPLQGVNAMNIRNPGCCPGLGAVALSGRAIAFDLHDNLGLHYWLHLSNYINLQQNEIAQKTTHE